MKKTAKFLAALILAFLIFPQSALADYQGRIVGTYVRLREGPGTEFDIVAEYNTGKTVTVKDQVGSWMYCIVDDNEGFIHSDYIEKLDEESIILDAAQTPQTPVQVITIPVSSPPEITQPAETEYVIAEDAPMTPSPLQSEATFVIGVSDPIPTPTPTAASSFAESLASLLTWDEQTMYVIGNTVPVRDEPSFSGKIIQTLPTGTELLTKGYYGDWSYAQWDEKEGYILTKYLTTENVAAVTGKTEAVDANGITGTDIANMALSLVGTKYSWGGSDPKSGFDSSGLVVYIYSHYGYNLSRISNEMSRNGTHTPYENLVPGDIVCFRQSVTSPYIGHVGIYIGNNKYVHCSTPTSGVIISELEGLNIARFSEGRRIIG